MADSLFTGHTKYGTLGGIITIFLININSGDILRTIIFSAIGALVSVLTSFLVKYLWGKWQK